MTLKYPSNWIKTKEGFLSSLLTIYAPLDDISDRYYDNIRIKISNVTLQNITSLSQFIKERDNSLISLDGYKVIINGNTTLSGNPVTKLVFTFSDSDGQESHKIERITSIIGNKIYEIFLDSTPEKFDTYIPIMDEVVSSLKIAGSNLE